MSDSASPIYSFSPGTSPLLISVPHAGTEVPVELRRRFTSSAQSLPDTDWHVDRLYELTLTLARELGASLLVATHSRYVVDLNRSPDSAALYANEPTSPVCPDRTFAGDPIYMSAEGLQPAEIQARIGCYWRPYHERLEQELARLRAEHGFALLWDAHSVASEVPGLFQGVLPEFNFGSRDNAACPRDVAQALLDVVTRDAKYDAVLDGRFKGGYITLHYGQPAQKIYAIQLELAQRAYLDEGAPRDWDAARAQGAASVIAQLLERYVEEGRRRLGEKRL